MGYFERIDAERGIAWRAADSFGLRRFLGIGLDEQTPDHSTISRTRRLIDVETDRKVFFWVLELLRDKGLVKGKTVGIDATTLEANAAMRSIVRRDNGESYEEFLKGLAKESGIATPTREDLTRLDRRRKNKASNKDWVNPHDRDARITKMKDDRTHLAHKAEHAVDMQTGAVLVVTLQKADQGDTTTVVETLMQTGEHVVELIGTEAPDQKSKVHLKGIEELVTDKGYHSGAVLVEMKNARSKDLHAREEAGGPTALGGQIRGAASGLCKPAADEPILWQATAPEERRVDRAELYALLRHGWDEKDASAGTPEYSQSTFDSRRSIQSELDLPQPGIWNATRTEKSTVLVCSCAFWAD